VYHASDEGQNSNFTAGYELGVFVEDLFFYGFDVGRGHGIILIGELSMLSPELSGITPELFSRQKALAGRRNDNTYGFPLPRE